MHWCTSRVSMLCNQARQTAADLRWKEDERYETKEKERGTGSRTELTERHTAVHSCKPSRENRSKNCCCTCCRACAFPAFSENRIVTRKDWKYASVQFSDNFVQVANDKLVKIFLLLHCLILRKFDESFRYLFIVKLFGYRDAS